MARSRSPGNLRIIVEIIGFVVAVVLMILPAALTKNGRGNRNSQTRAELSNIAGAIKQFEASCGPLRVTNNAEIIFVLTGGNSLQNPAHTTFLVLATNQLDSAGNLLDAWGKPFCFQSLSNGTQLRIQSLGKNGKDDQGKGDDIVIIIPLMKRD